MAITQVTFPSDTDALAEAHEDGETEDSTGESFNSGAGFIIYSTTWKKTTGLKF